MRLKNAPVLFQEYIPGDNIRVYVLGNNVISSAIIYTQEVDYRGNEEEVKRIELPEDVKNMCIKAAEICGLRFTGIDLKRKGESEFIILECNPSPMFIGFQNMVGDPIDKMLAEFLIQNAK
jgi:glutathione synthase/RimK-type ligase-like ATP-grasp enzyme